MIRREPLSTPLNELQANYRLIPMERAVANPNLDIYRASGTSGDLLVKHFKPGKLEAAAREKLQYDIFGMLSFVPQLKVVTEDSTGIYMAYEWIDGTNLYDLSRANGDQSLEQEQTVLRQIIELGNVITPEMYYQLQNSGSKFSLSNPLYRGVLSQDSEAEFDSSYAEITDILKICCKLFPGIYSDRNPGNIIAANSGDLYHVDFGVIEASTPLFDLTKFLRTRTGEPSTIDLKSDVLTLPKFDYDLEAQKVMYFFYQYQEKSQFSFHDDPKLFLLGYYYAALNEHIFYLSKAIDLIRSGTANKIVQQSRIAHHSKMLADTLFLLHQNNERLFGLHAPIDNLLKSAYAVKE